MKVLSLNPPYGSLIAACQRFPELGKRIETRGWSTNYRGLLAIHQTAGLGEMFADEEELAAFCAEEPVRSTLAALGITEAAQLPRGMIVAQCQLRQVLPIPRDVSKGWGFEHATLLITERELAFGNYAPGRYALLLADVQALDTPIPARGMPGLWEYEGEL
jgi:activating signal cointegrator 1